jgi:hypothetical protein
MTMGRCTLKEDSLDDEDPEFTMPPRAIIRGPSPSVSFDGRSSKSKVWGKRSRFAKMCPHVMPQGGVCGLEAEFCLCVCLLCGGDMEARKRCGATLKDGSMCPWGQDRSPEVSEPEQEPSPPRMRKAWYMDVMYLTPVAARKRKSIGSGAATDPRIVQSPVAPVEDPSTPVRVAAPVRVFRSIDPRRLQELQDRCHYDIVSGLPNLEPGAPSQPPPGLFSPTRIVTWTRTVGSIAARALTALAKEKSDAAAAAAAQNASI